MSQPVPMATDLRLNTTLTGLTVFGRKKVRLEWTREDRIRIIDLKGPQERVLADLAPRDVAKARYVPAARGVRQGTLDITTVAGRKFRIMIERVVLSPLPGETVEQYNVRVARQGVPTHAWWTHRLAAFGVDAKRTGAGVILLWVLSGVVGLFVVIMIFGFIVSALG